MEINLKNLIMEYDCPNEESIKEEVILNCHLTFLQLRDFLISAGEVLYEDIENKVYVAFIRSGKHGINGAKFAIQLHGSKLNVVGYINEGLIKQNLWVRSFSKLERACLGEKPIEDKLKSKRKKYLLYGLLVILSIIVISIGLLFGEIQQTRTATKIYNVAVSEYNEQVELYNKFVEMTCIDNISGLPIALESLSTEDEGFFANLLVVLGSNNKDIIVTDTNTINGMTNQVKEAEDILKQITAPTSDFVMERLSTIENITGTQAVTQELDPDGLLGKEGGFRQ